jgi:predicted amidophosphoribosyltransferase
LLLLGQGISDTLGVPMTDNAVAKVKATEQLKNAAPGTKSRLALLEAAYAVAKPLIAGQRVLLLDDLYDSGATMKSITDRLYDEGGAAAVYALTFTITRTGTRTGART